MGFKRYFSKIHDNIDVVRVANEIKPYSVKILSLTPLDHCLRDNKESTFYA